MKRTKPPRTRRTILTMLLLGLFTFAGVSECVAALHANLDHLGDAIAAGVQSRCTSNLPKAGKHRIAVFKFCDKNYKYNPNTMGNLGNISATLVQDKLKTELSKGATNGKYEVLDQADIDLLFTATSTSKLSVFSPNAAKCRKVCAGVGIDVIVLTRFLFNDIKDVRKNPRDDVRVEVKVIFPNSDGSFSTTVESSDVLLNCSLGPFPPFTGGATPPPKFTPNTSGTPRLFDVNFFLRINPGNKNDADPRVWEPIKLKVAANPSSASYGTFFLELDEAKHKNKRFKITLKYKGPRNGVTDFLARERIYAAALTIDGLDSFYHTKGKLLKPKFVHPHNAQKWVLTPPGYQIVPAPRTIMGYPGTYAWGKISTTGGLDTPPADKRHKKLGLGNAQRMTNGILQQVRGIGHSTRDVRGFQRGAKFADAFVFKTGGQSLANLAGSVADVGEIKVYFYGEDLPLPKGVKAAAYSGVGTGKKIKNPVFPIKLRFDKNPHEVWTIKYRYANSKNPPPVGLAPVTGTFP